MLIFLFFRHLERAKKTAPQRAWLASVSYFFLKILLEMALISFYQKEEIKSCEERVKRLLEIIPPKGKEFLQSVEHILEREKNWVNIFFNINSHSCLEV